TTTTSTTTTTTTSTTSTTTTTTSTTSTTTLPLTACPASGHANVVTTLVPNANTFNSLPIRGIEVDLVYPAAGSMPGSMFLPLGDPSDPSTLIVLLSATPGGINLYDGLVTFFDSDTAAPLTLQTLLTLNQTANLTMFQPVLFERARFTCTPGAALSAGGLACSVTSETDSIARSTPPEQRTPCSAELSAP